MPFGYYAGLSRRKKAFYRRSDALTDFPLPCPAALRLQVDALREALGAARVDVEVRSRRPKDDEAELHGLYELEEGKRGRIQIWMRTASRREVVAFRTFFRTLVHELCHHLDFACFDLGETFHTEGFFRRESSLVRALDPEGGAPAGARSGRSPIRSPRDLSSSASSMTDLPLDPRPVI